MILKINYIMHNFNNFQLNRYVLSQLKRRRKVQVVVIPKPAYQHSKMLVAAIDYI